MRYLYFSFGLIFWLIFAYDIEYDKDFITWLWLFLSLFSFVNSFVVYQYDMKYKKEQDLKSEKIECDCINGVIECPGCKGALEKDRTKCAGCNGKKIVTCGVCGGNNTGETILVFEKGESKKFSKEQVEIFEKIVERNENNLMLNTNHYHWITFHLSINSARVNYPINSSTLWTANHLLKQKGLVVSIEAAPLDEKTYNTIMNKKLW